MGEPLALDLLWQDDPDLILPAIHNGAEINHIVPGEGTPLYKAVMYEFTALVDCLLEHGADPNLSEEGRENPFTAATINADLTMMKKLLDAGADVNRPGYDGTPALLYSVPKEIEVMRFLLDHGADVNATNNLGSNALIDLIEKEIAEPEKIHLLLDAGIDPLFEHDHGFSALRQATSNKDENTVRLLLEHGVPPDENRPENAYTALMIACRNRHTEMARLLLHSGADPERTNHRGESARSLAQLSGEIPLIDLF